MPTTAPKPYVFVLMPFHESFADVYELGIKAACEQAGAYCDRVDEQVFVDSMLSRIYNSITKADLLVADMTGKNPNVFYEVGYAHALGKPVLLLTQAADDIPFDLKHFPHLVYDRHALAKLHQGIKDRVSNLLRQSSSIARTGMLSVYLDGRLADDQKPTTLVTQWSATATSPLVLQGVNWGTRVDAYGIVINVDVQNPATRPIVSPVTLGLVLPAPLSSGQSEHKIIKLPEGRFLHQLPVRTPISPRAWESLRFVIDVTPDGEYGPQSPQREVAAEVHVYDDSGLAVYPVSLAINPFPPGGG